MVSSGAGLPLTPKDARGTPRDRADLAALGGGSRPQSRRLERPGHPMTHLVPRAGHRARSRPAPQASPREKPGPPMMAWRFFAFFTVAETLMLFSSVARVANGRGR